MIDLKCKNTLKCYQKMVENNYNFEINEIIFSGERYINRIIKNKFDLYKKEYEQIRKKYHLLLITIFYLKTIFFFGNPCLVIDNRHLVVLMKNQSVWNDNFLIVSNFSFIVNSNVL